MKIFLKLLAAGTLVTAASSCSSFLDVNSNANQFTTATAPAPNAILAQALNATATLYSINYNSYASFAADYWAKSGYVSGFAEERTYTYTSTYYQGLWTSTYDNLNDYNIIQQAAANYPNHAAIARIMKVYDYLLLVDEYGDVPYTQALKGTDNLTPTYDKATDIYKDFIVQLQGAITDINNNTPTKNPTALAVGTEDIVFGGGTAGMTKWKQFANSLQLRILLRESQTNDAALNTYVQQQLTALQTAADGFITIDVQVNPGFAQSSGQQNPFYNRYGVTFTGTSSAAERYFQVPSDYVIALYSNNNTGIANTPAGTPIAPITYNSSTADPRLTVLYTVGKKGTQSAYYGAAAGESSPPSTTAPNLASFFLRGTATVTSAGLLKGFNAPVPLMLLSEQLFNKAEAETRGLFTGGDAAAKTDFNNGILASFVYFYRPAATAATTLPTASATSTVPGVAPYVSYIATASTNPNINYDGAATSGSLGKQSIILLQKYLAMNTVASTEGWDDYRRAAQPKIRISFQASQSKFPKRLLYPQTEVNTNNSNIPQGITQYTPIFWDVVD